MSKRVLVIVESRAKCPKIETILGSGYVVRACYGHLQSLVNVDEWIEAHEQHGWNPDTIRYRFNSNDKLKAKTLTELRKLAKDAPKVIIASDMDREGEAIGYHLRDLLKLKNKPHERIVFDQITPEAIRAAVDNPVPLREPLYRAQQARSVIDMLFGYRVSRLLNAIQFRLSAGRCQSPALRWLWERQNAFMTDTQVVPKHNIDAQLVWQAAFASKGKGGSQTDKSVQVVGKYKGDSTSVAHTKTSTAKASPTNDDDATHAHKHAVLYELQTFREWVIVTEARTQPKQSPPHPFTTSALQQKCYHKFKWSPKSTMRLAQQLYEAGHITYMRTDCKTLSAPFVKSALAYLHTRFGTEYVRGATTSAAGAAKPSKKKKAAHAQEAHEPIRPTHANHTHLTPSEKAALKADGARASTLYKLIYETTLSSLMTPCVLNKSAFVLHPRALRNKPCAHALHVEWTGIFFPGWRVWEVLHEKPFVPKTCTFEEGSVFRVVEYASAVKHHIPNKPYTSGDLLKLLETRGVGRPSTYSNILDTLDKRQYVSNSDQRERVWAQALQGHPLTKHANEEIRIDMEPATPKWTHKKMPSDVVQQLRDRYHVTAIGNEVASYLTTHLDDLIDASFTESLENKLDAITREETTYQAVVSEFYKTLTTRIKALRAEEAANGNNSGAPTGSPFAKYYNQPSKRVLHESDDHSHAYVALLTRNGPAVALFRHGSSTAATTSTTTGKGKPKGKTMTKKKLSDGVFASLPANTTIHNVTYEVAKELIANKLALVESGVADTGRLVGKLPNGTDVHEKDGRYGKYLTWVDKDTGTAQSVSLGSTDKHTTTTIEQAQELIQNAKLKLHTVNTTYKVMYNQANDSVYLSKRPASGKGRPTYAPLSNLTKADTAKIAELTASECDALYDLHQQQKANKANAKTKRTSKGSSSAPPKKSKQTQTAPKPKKAVRKAAAPKKKKSSSRKRPSSKQSVKKKQ